MLLLNPSCSFPRGPEQCYLTWHHWVETQTGGVGEHPPWFYSHISKTVSENLSCVPEHLAGRGVRREQSVELLLHTTEHRVLLVHPSFAGDSFIRRKALHRVIRQVFLSAPSLPEVTWWHFSLPASCDILTISSFSKMAFSRTVVREAHVWSFSKSFGTFIKP